MLIFSYNITRGTALDVLHGLNSAESHSFLFNKRISMHGRRSEIKLKGQIRNFTGRSVIRYPLTFRNSFWVVWDNSRNIAEAEQIWVSWVRKGWPFKAEIYNEKFSIKFNLCVFKRTKNIIVINIHSRRIHLHKNRLYREHIHNVGCLRYFMIEIVYCKHHLWSMQISVCIWIFP